MPLSDELFDRILPLPFRVIALLNIGSWLWLVVLKTLEKANLNISALFKYPQNQSFIKSHLVISESISIISFVAYLLYGIFRDRAEESLNLIDIIPLFTIIFIVWSFSARFKQTFRRVLQCKIDLSIRSNDIVLSDSLLSYSKVLVDLLVYVLHLFNMKTSYQVDNKIMINRSFGEFWNLGHLVLLHPVTIRVVQSLYEYKTNGNIVQLWNAGKYLTNALIILTSLITERSEVLFLLQFIGAVYSFIWDLTIDWEFNILKKVYHGNLNGLNLRSTLLVFRNERIYYFIIAFNFLIRFNWVVRYMSIEFMNLEIALFTLEVLEILRRFLWILIKLDVDFGKMNEFELSAYHES
jgi:hypothetical protein